MCTSIAIFAREGDERGWDCTVNITIRDAECYASNTSSAFTFYMGSMDFSDNLVMLTSIESNSFEFDKKKATRRFFGKLRVRKEQYVKTTLTQCIQQGHLNCLPRADVVFIRFENNPDDPWTIDQIDVDVYFQLGSGREHWHMWHFEHAVLRPCYSWMKDSALYQIGPRTGLFLKLNYLYLEDTRFPPIDSWTETLNTDEVVQKRKQRQNASDSVAFKE